MSGIIVQVNAFFMASTFPSAGTTKNIKILNFIFEEILIEKDSFLFCCLTALRINHRRSIEFIDLTGKLADK